MLLELACLGMACEPVAEKLRLYSRGNAVSIVEASDTFTSSDTGFRITLRAESEGCSIEVLDVADESAPRVARVGCGNPRQVALHIKSEIDADFEHAAALIASQPKKRRIAKSTLLPQPQEAASTPASAPASEPASAPVMRPLATPRMEQMPASATLEAPHWQAGIALFGTISGVGGILFGSGAIGITLKTPWPVFFELGVHADFRPPLPRLSLTFVTPYARAGWRFALHDHVTADVALHGELPIGMSRRTFVNAGLGAASRWRFPLGRIAPFVDLRAVGNFYETTLQSGPPPALTLVPFLWSVGAGLEIVF